MSELPINLQKLAARTNVEFQNSFHVIDGPLWQIQ